MTIAVGEISEAKITRFCQRWKIQELSVFGSALREDFDAASDIDMLVVFADDAEWGLLDHVQMEQELKQLLGRDVDLISKWAVEQSQNWIRSQEILKSARVIFSKQEDTMDLIDSLFANPIRRESFRPLNREELYVR